MKLVLFLILTGILLFALVIFLNYQNSEQIYNFCNLHSTGNAIETAKQNATRFKLKLMQKDHSTLAFKHSRTLPLLPIYVCEIKYENGKIIQQNFVKY